MDDYIGREALLADISATIKHRGMGAIIGKTLMRYVKRQPAADVAPVVRCKDCKYYKPDEYECGCDFAGGLPYVKAGDFCSYGERREDT